MKENDETTLVEVEIPLSQRDIVNIANRIAKLSADEDSIKQEKSASAAKYNGKLKAITSELKAKSKAIRDGFVTEEIACVQDFDYESGMVIFSYPDTGKKISERKMTNEEKQMSLL